MEVKIQGVPVGKITSLSYSELAGPPKQVAIIPTLMRSQGEAGDLVLICAKPRKFTAKITKFWMAPFLRIAMHRKQRNPPLPILRLWAVTELGWANRKFKRTRLSVIKQLWRRKMRGYRGDSEAHLERR